MKIALYVDWEEKKILTANQLEEMHQDYVNDIVSEDFRDWINDNYYAAEIFVMDEDEKQNLFSMYKSTQAESNWKDYAEDCYEEVTIDV